MKRRVLVVDYGVGNLLSVCRAFEACGATVELTGDIGRLNAAERVVVPGVGAFGDCMNELNRRSLVKPILDFIASGRPLLGICVGMQMFMEIGEEFGEHGGLGLVPGRVRAIPSTAADGSRHKIPHIGWNALVKLAGTGWSHTILDGVTPGSTVYFVHSFTANPEDERYRLADCDYNGRRISAALQVGNVFGTQFHPEKSGEVGLRILRNFLALERVAAGADRVAV
ncbi:MAG: imidazole glycerol phosphate synthase subunit HisH [Xanthobacteraceae bacterium]|nr:imidazole glycerol phosphate synthase subunit HisH [Xanthobacteraceae bacterium]